MWLQPVLLLEAATALWLSVLNILLLARVIGAARRPARRAAAVVLACVCGGQALEALLFLWLNGPSAASDGWSSAAVFALRTAVLISAAAICLMLLRSPAGRVR